MAMQDWEYGKGDVQLHVKTLDECAATHVVAAFDDRISGRIVDMVSRRLVC